MKLSTYLVIALLCQVACLSSVSYADTLLFSDNFESADTSIWSANDAGRDRLTSTNKFSRSGAYSAHNPGSSGVTSVQQFKAVDTGVLRINWWVMKKETTAFGLAGFYTGSNSAAIELSGVEPTDLVAIPRGGYKSGLATIEAGIWYQLSIAHDFDKSITRFYFQGNEVYEAEAQESAISQLIFQTLDSELYIDDVEVIHEVIEEVPTNVDLVSDTFSGGTTAGWAFDHPQLVAVNTFSRQGGFSVHKPAGSTGTHGLAREFSVQSNGKIETSWWVLATGSDVANTALFSLGDELSMRLLDGGTKLSLSATNATTQSFKPEIRTLSNETWYKLGISYNFETNTASFLLNDSTIHEVSIDIPALKLLTLTSDDSAVYIDEIMINNSEPVTVPLEQPSLAVATVISEIGIDLISRVENARVVASWTEVPGSDGYRLYYSTTAFSDLGNIESIEFGSNTSVEAFLPYGSRFHIAIGAHKDGSNIALSNREIVDIPALEPRLTATVNARGVLTANWEATPNAENYRLYYSTSKFTNTDNIAFADMGTSTKLEVELFAGANYYVGLAIKAKDNPESALSNLEHIAYRANLDRPIFPPPPTLDTSRLLNCCTMLSDKPYVDEFGFQWGHQVVQRPIYPSPPTLTPLETLAGEPGNTVIAANSLISLPPFNSDTTNYVAQAHDSDFSWRDLHRVSHFSGLSRATEEQQLSFGVSIDFDEKDYGSQVFLFIALSNDAGVDYYLSQNGSWYTADELDYIPHYAFGIASAGTHTVVGLRHPSMTFGEIQVSVAYEIRGLTATESRTVVTKPFKVTLEPAFHKLDNKGSRLPDNASEWSCVHDSKTGLTWEVKTHDGGLRDAKHTYSWYDSDSKFAELRAFVVDQSNGVLRGMGDNGGDCFDSSNCDTEKYISQVNATGLCGSNDWRMPNVNELQMLARGFSFFDAPWYQDHYLDDAGDFYWSGTSNPGGAGLDWAYYQLLTNMGGCSVQGSDVCRTTMSTKNKIYAVRGEIR